jgi:tetratricopeptide (TPR) repeat protein
MKTLITTRLPALALCLAAGLAHGATADNASASTFDAGLLAIQTYWAEANYQLHGDAQEAAFDRLMEQAANFTGHNPGRAEPLIWEGIVLSTAAGVKGGLGALGLAKQARARLDAALAIDAQALQGSAYTSLGTLYHKVPGFPIGFGSDKKAREYLEKALAINPAGIDSNYFYGEFLLDEGDEAAARRHLEKALKAPPRPNRELADEGRRGEVRALLAKISRS